MLWSEMNPGEAFRIREPNKIGRVLIKAQPDPFGCTNIGDTGCFDPYTGETHNVTQFIDVQKPLEQQVEWVDMMEHNSIIPTTL